MDNKNVRGFHGKVKAFTLLELVIVLAIISVLMMIAVPNILAYMRDARVTSANTTAQELYNATQDYLISLQIRNGHPEDYFGNKNGVGVIGGVFDGKTMSLKANASYNTGVNSLGGHVVHYASGTELANSGKSVFGTKVDKTGAETALTADNALVAANEILRRMNTDFEGAWIVEIYPATYTVKAVYFTSEKANGEYRWDSAKAVYNDPYINYPSTLNPKPQKTQDEEAHSSSSLKHYTGQYPVLDPPTP